mgnify:CR=1 FL=1
MEFGFSLPGRGPLAGLDVVLKIAEKADALRLQLAVRHRSHRHAGVVGEVGISVHRQRAVSGRTRAGLPRAARDAQPSRARDQRVRLGISVLVDPVSQSRCSPPRCWRRSDVLSKGRVILGAGVGWLREEFEALGAPPFEERGPVTEEYIRLMRAAWTTDPVSFEGKYYSVRDVHVLPKPVQQRRHPGLDRRPHRRGAAAGRHHRRRLASDRHAAAGAPRPGRVRGEGHGDPRLGAAGRARPEVDRPDHPRPDGSARQATPRPPPAIARRSRAAPDEVAADIRRYQALGVIAFRLRPHGAESCARCSRTSTASRATCRPKVLRAAGRRGAGAPPAEGPKDKVLRAPTKQVSTAPV